MPNKEKLLEALDCTIDDVSEERLVDVLLDSYAKMKERIKVLEAENSGERERLHYEMNNIQEERMKMRRDPTYWTAGDFYFIDHVALMGQKMRVRIVGTKIELSQRRGNVDFVMRQVSGTEWGIK